jgi:hypothetical protein
MISFDVRVGLGLMALASSLAIAQDSGSKCS